MGDKQNLIFWGIIALVGIGLILYSFFYKSSESLEPDTSPIAIESATPEPTPTLTPTPAYTPRPSPKPTLTEESFLGLNGIKSPATCQVWGEVRFTSVDSFLSLDSRISWQNIDSRGRLIKWHVSPEDNLAVGPNIFESLPLPDGEYQNLTVRLPEKPIAKSYLLTTSVTYGQFVKGNLEIKEANCIGQVKVNLNF